jgi:SPP1 gp7 family putative phage head morphogenesis protein
MAKDFSIPAWRKKLIAQKFQRKAKVINSAVDEMEKVVFAAIDYVIYHYRQTGMYVDPPLTAMELVGESFYRDVLKEAIEDAEDQKAQQGGRKRLAKWPTGIPTTIRGLEQIFRDRRYWPTIMRRSKKLVDRMRKSYVQKLRRKFRDLIPRLIDGDISPEEAKAKMVLDWQATKPRVETIFRTETTTYFAKTQVAYFKGDEDILGFLYDSVKDQARTDICRSRHGLIYRPDHTGDHSIAYNTPALHFNCRSHLIPLTNTAANRKLVEDPNRDPINKAVAPLPPGWSKQGSAASVKRRKKK